MPMGKNIVTVLVAILLSSGLLAGCVGGVGGSGNLDTQEFNFSGFTRVDVGHAFEVEIIQSDSYSVSITADDNLFKHIHVSKQGETLKIGLKLSPSRLLFTTLRAKITMPELYALELSGATRGTVEGFIELSGASSLDISDMAADDIEFDLSGASKVTGDITAGDAEFDVSGASKVQLQGSASDIVIDASGASQLSLDNFPGDNADIKLSGASRATVNVDGRLDVDLSGASKLDYIGEPTMGNIEISAGSTLSRK